MIQIRDKKTGVLLFGLASSCWPNKTKSEAEKRKKGEKAGLKVKSDQRPKGVVIFLSSGSKENSCY